MKTSIYRGTHGYTLSILRALELLDHFLLVSAKMLSTWHLARLAPGSPRQHVINQLLINIDHVKPYKTNINQPYQHWEWASDWKLHGLQNMAMVQHVELVLGSQYQSVARHETCSRYETGLVQQLAGGLVIIPSAQIWCSNHPWSLKPSHCGNISHCFTPWVTSYVYAIIFGPILAPDWFSKVIWWPIRHSHPYKRKKKK